MPITLQISREFSLPAEAVSETFAMLAKRGVGKTYTAAVMVEELLKTGLHAVVGDPVGVWWGLRTSPNGTREGLPIIVLGGDHGDMPLEVNAGEPIADVVVDEELSVALDLSHFRKGEQTRFMTDFAERLYHKNRTPLHLVLDEADAFAPQRPLKGQECLLGAVEDLIRRGRAEQRRPHASRGPRGAADDCPTGSRRHRRLDPRPRHPAGAGSAHGLAPLTPDRDGVVLVPRMARCLHARAHPPSGDL